MNCIKESSDGINKTEGKRIAEKGEIKGQERKRE